MKYFILKKIEILFLQTIISIIIINRKVFKTMSRQQSTIKPQQSSGKPFCIFCKNLNLDESIYTSHNCRTPNGKVICTKLLDTTCPNCQKKGHTKSHCTKAQQSTKAQQQKSSFKSDDFPELVKRELPKTELPKKYSVIAKFRPLVQADVEPFKEDTMQTIHEKLAELKKEQEEELKKEQEEQKKKRSPLWKEVIDWESDEEKY